MALPQQLDRAVDHVLDRGHGGQVGLVAPDCAQQIHHVLGGIDPGEGHVAIGIRVRMAWQVAFLRLSPILDDLDDPDSGQGPVQLGLEGLGERRTDGFGGENRILAPIGPPGRRARGLRVGQVFRQQLGARGTELEFVIMVIAVSCVKLLSAHNSTQHTSRKHKV
jgi:hypothetical protein